MTLADKMFGLETAKAIWVQKGKSTVHVRRGYLVLIQDKALLALIKETVYGPYVRVSHWPFLGYGRWINRDEIHQIVEPTYLSVIVNFLRRALRCRAVVFKS